MEFAALVDQVVPISGMTVLHQFDDVVRLTDGEHNCDLHWELLGEGWAVRIGRYDDLGFDKQRPDDRWVVRIGSLYLPFLPQLVSSVLTPQFSYESCLERWPNTFVAEQSETQAFRSTG